MGALPTGIPLTDMTDLMHYLRRHRLLCGSLLLTLLTLLPGIGRAQESLSEEVKQMELEGKKVKGYLVPMRTEFGETLPTISLGPVSLYREMKYATPKERRTYERLVRDVKKTLPYAKMVNQTMMETYEYLQTLPDDRAREAHLKRMQKELYEQYKPDMKKLTLRQGKLLLKLITRETSSTSYELIDSFLGGFAAGFWNMFAKFFGASLKAEYDPVNNAEDAMIERVCTEVEYGLI